MCHGYYFVIRLWFEWNNSIWQFYRVESVVMHVLYTIPHHKTTPRRVESNRVVVRWTTIFSTHTHTHFEALCQLRGGALISCPLLVLLFSHQSIIALHAMIQVPRSVRTAGCGHTHTHTLSLFLFLSLARTSRISFFKAYERAVHH